MPESVLSPAPVRTTSRPSRAGWALNRPPVGKALNRPPAGKERSARGSRVARLGAGARLGGLDLTVLRGRRRGQPVEQPEGGRGHLGHGQVERRLVGRARSGRATDLADVLHGGGVHLVPAGGRLEVVEGAYVSAHAPRLRRTWEEFSGSREHRRRGPAG